VFYHSLLFLTLLLFGCSFDETMDRTLPNDIDKNNIVRKQIGLRVIKGLYFYGRRDFAEDWNASKTADGLCKRVQRDANKNLLWEEDYYFSGFTYTTIDGKCWEQITIHYDYKTKLLEATYIGPNALFQKQMETLKLPTKDYKAVFRVVNGILSKWKLKPNPSKPQTP
jgi:hypothetical protein